MARADENRVTTYLQDGELELLLRLERELGASKSYILRNGLRLLAGAPAAEWAYERAGEAVDRAREAAAA